MSKSLTVTCFGVCRGDPKYRSPGLNLPCALCGGSGKVTVYDQRQLDAEEWDRLRVKRSMPTRVRAG